MILLGQPTEWEKIFVNDITNKELISNTYTTHTTQHQKTTTTTWFNGHRINKDFIINEI